MAKREMTEAQKATQFKPGQSGNPGGIDQHTRAKMALNARKATDLRTEFLDSLESRIETIRVKNEEDGTPELAPLQINQMLTSDINTLLRDTENRGYGNPTQPLTGEGGGPMRTITTDMTPREAAEAYAAELQAQTGGRSDK